MLSIHTGVFNTEPKDKEKIENKQKKKGFYEKYFVIELTEYPKQCYVFG